MKHFRPSAACAPALKDDRHRRVLRTLEGVLADGTSRAWQGMTVVLMARLSEPERASLVYASVQSLPPEIGQMTAEAALADGMAAPLPPLFDAMDHARDWVAYTSPAMRDAIAAACYEAMPPDRRAAFLAWGAAV